jgi:hypothetical protein
LKKKFLSKKVKREALWELDVRVSMFCVPWVIIGLLPNITGNEFLL